MRQNRRTFRTSRKPRTPRGPPTPDRRRLYLPTKPRAGPEAESCRQKRMTNPKITISATKTRGILPGEAARKPSFGGGADACSRVCGGIHDSDHSSERLPGPRYGPPEPAAGGHTPGGLHASGAPEEAPLESGCARDLALASRPCHGTPIRRHGDGGREQRRPAMLAMSALRNLDDLGLHHLVAHDVDTSANRTGGTVHSLGGSALHALDLFCDFRASDDRSRLPGPGW